MGGQGWEMGNWGNRIVVWNLKPREADLVGILFLSRLPLLDLSFTVSRSHQDFPVLPVSPLRRCVCGGLGSADRSGDHAGGGGGERLRLEAVVGRGSQEGGWERA